MSSLPARLLYHALIGLVTGSAVLCGWLAVMVGIAGAGAVFIVAGVACMAAGVLVWDWSTL